MNNHNTRILSQYFDNDNILFNNESYRDFYKSVFDKASKGRAVESKDQEPLISIVRYNPSDIKQFLNDFFLTLINGDIAYILHFEMPQSEKLHTEAIEQYKTLYKAKKNEYPAVILRTSGSSGTPKNVVFDLNSLFLSAQETIDHYGLNIGEKWGCTLPLNHIGGLMILIRTLKLKSEFIAINSSNITNEDVIKIDYLSLVPTQLKKLVDQKLNFKNIKGIVLGGAKPNLESLRELSTFNIKLASSYGMSETCAQVTSTPFTDDLDLLVTSGRPIGNSKFFLANGRIQIDSERLALGYLDGTRFGKTFTTQDLGRLDNNGNLIIEGRIDDVIISGGENINLNEVSEVLDSFYPHSTSVVLPFEDKHFGEISYSIINYKEKIAPLSEKDLKDSISEKLESFKVPKKIFYSTTALNNEEKIKLKITKSEKISLSKKIERFNFLYKMKLNCLHMGNISAQPLFIFHGFMGNHTDFNFLLNESSILENYHLILIDLPLHGKSTLLKEFSTLVSFCQSFASELDKQELSSTFLGYSLGGRIAYEISKTLKSPSKFILESSSLGIEDSKDKISRLRQDANFMGNVASLKEFRDELHRWYKMEIFNGLNKEQIEELVTNKDYEQLKNYKEAASFYSPSHQEYITPDKIKHNHEYHYIHGQLDKKYAELAVYFSSNFSINSASHNAHYMNKNEYLSHVRSLLLK